MHKTILYILLLSCCTLACNNDYEHHPKDRITQDSSSQKKQKGHLFEDDQHEDRSKKVFSQILSEESRAEAAVLLQEIKSYYRLPWEDKLSASRIYNKKIYGSNDSIWVLEADAFKDSLCQPLGLHRQLVFDSKGHLIFEDSSAFFRWVDIRKDKAPLLMTLNTDCNGLGQHHFYKYEDGQLLDIFNVLLENTPNTFDANGTEDSVVYQPNELELKITDKNNDGRSDLTFSGKRQLMKGNTVEKTEPVEYVFIYQPGEDWFVQTSIRNKKEER